MSISSAPRRRSFQLLPDIDCIAERAGARKRSVLGQSLMMLLETAQLNCITLLDGPDAGWTAQMREIMAASAWLDIEAELPLSDVLSTSVLDFANGYMAQALASRARRTRRRSTPGILISLCNIVGPRGAFASNRRSIFPRDGLDGNFMAGGPYLVLAVCALDALDRLHVVTGYAQPVLDRGRFFPVSSDFERDVVKLLTVFQQRLHDLGFRSIIRRPLRLDDPNHPIEFLLEENPELPWLSVTVCAHMPDNAKCKHTCGHIKATLEGLADGSFVEALQAAFHMA